MVIFSFDRMVGILTLWQIYLYIGRKYTYKVFVARQIHKKDRLFRTIRAKHAEQNEKQQQQQQYDMMRAAIEINAQLVLG